MIFLSFAVLANFSACRQWNNLIGKDNKDDAAASNTPAPAPAPTPAPAPPPGPSQFDVFTDQGGVLHDSEGAITTDGIIHYDVRNSTPSPEGSQYIHTHVEEDHSGQHIRFTFDKNNNGRTVDLSAFTTISFFIRLDRRHLPADDCNIYFEDGAGHNKDIEIRDLPGINTNTLAWQSIDLPVSALSGLDLSKMKTAFGIHPTAADPVAVGPHVDLDAIVWKR